MDVLETAPSTDIAPVTRSELSHAAEVAPVTSRLPIADWRRSRRTMGVWALSSLVAPIPGAGKSLVGRAAAIGRAPAVGAVADVAGAADVGAGDRLRDSDGAAAGVVGAAAVVGAPETGDDGAAAAGTVAGAAVSTRAAGLTRRLRYVMSVRIVDLFSVIA